MYSHVYVCVYVCMRVYMCQCVYVCVRSVISAEQDVTNPEKHDSEGPKSPAYQCYFGNAGSVAGGSVAEGQCSIGNNMCLFLYQYYKWITGGQTVSKRTAVRISTEISIREERHLR